MNSEKYLTVTVDVEEWFHSNWFNAEHIKKTFYSGKTPQSDVIESIDTILSLFDDLKIKATFFVLGGTAERYPRIIDSIKDAGHELASHGYYHQADTLDIGVFRERLQKFRKDIYPHCKGFRFPNYIFQSDVLEVLSDEGFLYDSSIVPSHNIPGWYRDPQAPITPYVHQVDDNRSIMEFPISVTPGLRLPGAGGWFLRNVGFLWTYYVIWSQLKSSGYANIYFHNWEISNKNPRHPGIPFHVFRNTGGSMIKRIGLLVKTCRKMDGLHIAPFEELLDHEINQTC